MTAGAYACEAYCITGCGVRIAGVRVGARSRDGVVENKESIIARLASRVLIAAIESCVFAIIYGTFSSAV